MFSTLLKNRKSSKDYHNSLSGKPLPKNIMQSMSFRYNYNFENVRIYDETKAAKASQRLNANAYTLGNNIYFNSGKYQPETSEGKELLAHELAHVVQNSTFENTNQTENRANQAAKKISNGQNVAREQLGGSTQKLHLQEKEKKKEVKPKQGKEESVKIPMDKILKPPPQKTKKQKAPKLPSRIPIPPLSTGSFSVGLRLGFPELSENKLRLNAPDALKESMARAKLMNQVLTGNIPSGWEATDKAKLAQAIWGIFSENISPRLANKLTSGLTMPSPTSGVSYELDLVLITDFKKEIGGGAAFTVRW